MKPSDALQQDWRLYYDQAWMRHVAMGPGQVVVSGSKLYFYKYPDDMMENEPTQVRGQDLECWWPRSGSYNVPGGAIYIARKSTRSMRKSAHPNEHYIVKWGTVQYGNVNLMLQLRRGPSLVDPEFALRAIREQMTTSAAISQDIILCDDMDSIGVVFKGIRVGRLTDDIFEPDFGRSALVRRVRERLVQEGVI